MWLSSTLCRHHLRRWIIRWRMALVRTSARSRNRWTDVERYGRVSFLVIAIILTYRFDDVKVMILFTFIFFQLYCFSCQDILQGLIFPSKTTTRTIRNFRFNFKFWWYLRTFHWFLTLLISWNNLFHRQTTDSKLPKEARRRKPGGYWNIRKPITMIKFIINEQKEYNNCEDF